MLKIDEFESVFRSAIKEHYQHQEIMIKSVLLVTDLDAGKTGQLLSQMKDFCDHLAQSQNIHWHTAGRNDFKSAEDLIELINCSATAIKISVVIIILSYNINSGICRTSTAKG